MNKLKNVLIALTNPTFVRLRKKGFTYLSYEALLNIKQAVTSVEKGNVNGLFVETGCALGGSSILISLHKKKERQFNVYDVFGMIPPPTEKDGEDVHQRYEDIKEGKAIGRGDDLYYGYEKDLINKVRENFKSFDLEETRDNFALVQGLYEDSLLIDCPVAFAHIDCDWYSSVITCLKQIEPNLSNGGIMVIDDYFIWSGCKYAVDDYFKPEIKDNYTFLKKHGKLVITKNKTA